MTTWSEAKENRRWQLSNPGGSELEHRIYLDETGKRIWERHKYVKGPRYTFPEVWPEEELVKSDPGKEFAATSPCPEKKSGPRKQE